jgi:hypothetical protein
VRGVQQGYGAREYVETPHAYFGLKPACV